MFTRKTKTQKGFVIFYAVLVTSIVLTVSLLVADILTRQIIISSINKNYQYAYYTAQAGQECAKYYDSTEALFGLINALRDGNDNIIGHELIVPKIPTVQDLNCGSDPELSIDPASFSFDYQTGSSKAVTSFKLKRDDGATCTYAIVTVTLNSSPDPYREEKSFSIESRGYNICEDSNPRKVEAVAETSY